MWSGGGGEKGALGKESVCVEGKASLRFGKISIVFEDLSRNQSFFRTEVKLKLE